MHFHLHLKKYEFRDPHPDPWGDIEGFLAFVDPRCSQPISATFLVALEEADHPISNLVPYPLLLEK